MDKLYAIRKFRKSEISRTELVETNSCYFFGLSVNGRVQLGDSERLDSEVLVNSKSFIKDQIANLHHKSSAR